MNLKLEPGAIITDRYRLEHLLGQGGMGSVWQARHLLTHVAYAIKFLHPACAERLETRRRFLLEGQAAARVRHPNVVRIHEVCEPIPGTFALVMSLLCGLNLRQELLREPALSRESALNILVQIVAGAHAAHECGIVHRDLKPENIFILSGAGLPRIKILDFGIAKDLGDYLRTHATTPGAILGTFGYMSPEQAWGKPTIDWRSDIWSIGALAYEMFTGARPVEAATRAQTLKQLDTGCITPIDSILPDLPAKLAKLLMRMLARDPEDRPASLQSVYAELAPHVRAPLPSLAARALGPSYQ